ncbi:MAG: hypothetical protein K2Q24_17310 [Chitinophagaceae bacterium]|jgi:hypothetical protein|nr:hypothetical protein [Chitinophagaceae bacterium]
MQQKLIITAWLFISSALFIQCSKGGAEVNAFAPSASGQGGSLARFAIVGNYLYAVDKENLSVFKIQDAANPQLIKTTRVGFEIETIFPFKDKLFIGSTSVVHIFSIDNPENPVKLSVAVSPTVLRRCDPVVAKDTVAYATLRVNGECGGVQSILACYDIKNVLNPVQKSVVFVGEPYGLGYKDDVLYVCDKMGGLRVFDISKAYQPVQIKTLNDADWYIDVIPYNDVLICWTGTGAMLYNITDQRNPQLLITIQ